ncbi:MAG: hypothetical protein ACRERS_07645 [Methylococcales bacterium]
MTNPVYALMIEKVIQTRATNQVDIVRKVLDAVFHEVGFDGAMQASGMAFAPEGLKNLGGSDFIGKSTGKMRRLMTVPIQRRKLV